MGANTPINFEQALDDCLDRLNRGESLDECLALYPQYATELGPALSAFLDIRTASDFVPSPASKAAARQRFNQALERLESRRGAGFSLRARLSTWSKVWVTVTAALLIAVVGYFATIRPLISPVELLPPELSTEGSFAFLISDQPNAIEDFESLNVTITSIGLLLGDESGEWVELTPQLTQVDLTQLKGENAQEIWSGSVPEGQYTKVFINVSDVQGVLKETGIIVDIKLPSGRLQINSSFEVTPESAVSFVYDITVVAAGRPGDPNKYIIKPQAGESGANQPFKKVKD